MMHKVRNVRQTHQNVMDESDSYRYGRDSLLNEPVRHFVEQEGKKDSQITTTLHSVNENAQSGKHIITYTIIIYERDLPNCLMSEFPAKLHEYTLSYSSEYF